MYEIKTVKNYRTFADELAKKTGCSVKIKLMNDKGNHIHYQLNDKYDMTLGILCIDDGVASFAPFVNHDTVHNEQYISMNKFPMLEELIATMTVLRDMFME